MEQGGGSYLTLLPNPANGFVIVQSQLANDGYLTIYDQSGKTAHTILLPKGQQTSEIDTHNWQAGMYVYHLSDDDTVLQSGKLTVLHP